MSVLKGLRFVIWILEAFFLVFGWVGGGGDYEENCLNSPKTYSAFFKKNLKFGLFFFDWKNSLKPSQVWNLKIFILWTMLSNQELKPYSDLLSLRSKASDLPMHIAGI